MEKRKVISLAKWMPLILAIPAVCSMVAFLHLPETARADFLISDNGIVQQATYFFVFIAFFFALYRSFREKERFFSWAEASFLLLIYALREMDWHRKFTPEHVTKLKFYLGDYPLFPKVIGGIIILATGLIMLHFVLKNIVFFFKELSSFKLWSVYFAAWFILLGGAQIMDKSFLNSMFIGRAFEECTEFIASIIVCCTIIYFPLKTQNQE